MPASKTRSASRSTRTRSTSAKRGGEAALKQLNTSLEAAQKAMVELRGNLSRGGHELLKDVHKRIGDARRDTRRLNKSLLEDIGRLQEALGGRGKTGATSRSTGARKSSARKTTSRKASTGRSGAKRTSTAKRSTGSKARKKAR